MAILLTYSLLACPFRCLGDVPGSVVQSQDGEKLSPSGIASACSCCTKQSPSSPEDEHLSHSEESEVPVEDCACQCLCKGGIQPQEDSFELDLTLSGIAAQIASTTLVDDSLMEMVDSLNFYEIPDHPLCEDGQEIRLHVASLII
ncbi:hypothetical protein [Thalassoglobus polymorphus]|nr:hypothetical protein [Thalassoglobus polymorphus]